jgi:hypothetical protein
MSNIKACYKFPVGKNKVERYAYARSHKVFILLWCTFLLWIATTHIATFLWNTETDYIY